MDLRSCQAYWPLKNGILTSFPPLTSDQRCDVAILGGGITGALVAYHLVREGVGTIMLDKRDFAMGSAAASTCLLQYEIDKEWHELIDLVGEDHAVRAYRLGLESIDHLEELIRSLDDDCGFERRTSLYLASRKSHLDRLRREFECRDRFDFDVELLGRNDIEDRFPFTAAGGIPSRGDAMIDAFRLTHSLLRKSRAEGLKVHDRTTATRITPHSRHVVIETDRGATITAKRVVFATGYESQEYLTQSAGTLHRTFAAISEPIDPFPEWPDRCLIWETARLLRFSALAMSESSPRVRRLSAVELQGDAASHGF